MRHLPAVAVFSVLATLWGVAHGPPAGLVGLFDPGWRVGMPEAAGEHLVVTLPAGAEVPLEAWEARARGVAAVVRESPTTLWLVPLDPALGREPVERLVRPGGGSFEILPVKEGEGRGWREFADAYGGEVVASEQDLLEAGDEATARAAVAKGLRECRACRLASDEAIVFEGTRSWQDQEERWRALLVSRRPPIVDARHVASAEQVVDEQGRPAIDASLTPEGAELFERVTREHLDERLAIVLGDRVLMAPVVRGVISGGRLQIGLGAASPAEGRQLAASVLEVLRPGLALPAGTTFAWQAHPARDPSAWPLGWSLWLVCAALLGWALSALAGWGAGRLGVVVIEEAPAGEAGAWAAALGRLALTLGLGATGILLALVPVPFVEVDLQEAAGVSLGALGVGPILLASLLVSLGVWLVPRWAPLRSGSFAARRRTLAVTVVLALGLCALQGVGLVLYLRYLAGGLDGAWVEVGVIAALALGALALWGVGWLIAGLGLGQGLPILALVGGLVDGARAAATWPGPGGRLVVAALALGVVAAWLTRRGVRDEGRPTPRRLPLAGLTAQQLVATVVGMLALVAPWVVTGPLEVRLGLELALVVGGGVVLSWAVARPVGGRALLVGAATGIGLMVGVAFARALLDEGSGGGAGLVAVLGYVALPSLLADLGVEVVATARHGRLARVASMHAPDEATRLGQVLARAGIPAVSRGARFRALMRFMGPWAPVEVLVPRAQRAAALELIAADANAKWVAPFGE